MKDPNWDLFVQATDAVAKSVAGGYITMAEGDILLRHLIAAWAERTITDLVLSQMKGIKKSDDRSRRPFSKRDTP